MTPKMRKENPRSVVAAVLALALATSAPGPLAAQNACQPGATPTPRQTEGPFYKSGAPERADLVEPGMKGQPIEVSGLVLTRACQPIAKARVDVWQADAKGEYDNRGYRLRGFVLTDAQGRYRFRTVVPASYEGRTGHIHVKVTPPGGRTLATQFYFPDDPSNRTDRMFRRELVLTISRTNGVLTGRFDIVVE